jgi:prophage maintenance system killer protein
MNGLTIAADSEETYVFMVDAIAEGRFRFSVMLDWLDGHIKAL